MKLDRRWIKVFGGLRGRGEVTEPVLATDQGCAVPFTDNLLGTGGHVLKGQADAPLRPYFTGTLPRGKRVVGCFFVLGAPGQLRKVAPQATMPCSVPVGGFLAWWR